jgi:hypothetical protein
MSGFHALRPCRSLSQSEERVVFQLEQGNIEFAFFPEVGLSS